MEKRHTKITEGAGLQESRLNTEFIDWLNKWGSPILLLVLVVALGWVGWQWRQRHATKAMDDALDQYERAFEAGKPDNLVAVGLEAKGEGTVPVLSDLRAADLYLQAARRGMIPGGDPTKPEDIATPQQVAEYLTKSEELFTRALDASKNDRAYLLQSMSARSGLAAMWLTAGNKDKAKAMMQQIVEIARANKLEELAAWNKKRLSELDKATPLPKLYPQSQIAAANKPAPVDLSSMSTMPAGPFPPLEGSGEDFVLPTDQGAPSPPSQGPTPVPGATTPAAPAPTGPAQGPSPSSPASEPAAPPKKPE